LRFDQFDLKFDQFDSRRHEPPPEGRAASPRP